jgi:hypothetical protein
LAIQFGGNGGLGKVTALQEIAVNGIGVQRGAGFDQLVQGDTVF